MNAASPAGRPLRWYDYVIALLPFALAFTGAIGLAVGPAACALNLAMMRTSWPWPVRVAGAIVVALVAVFLWAFATVFMI
jgi:hypothetical protein